MHTYKWRLGATATVTFGPYMPNFSEFWEFLNVLIDAEGCPGCKQNGGRKCKKTDVHRDLYTLKNVNVKML